MLKKRDTLRVIQSTILLTLMLVAFTTAVSASLLDPNEVAMQGQARSDFYDEMMDAWFSSSRVVTSFDGKLWVPWYDSSTSCTINNLKKGQSCNAGTIDFEHNCMVTDEFSQMGILIAMGRDQERMDQFYNTVLAISSDRGKIPAWRVYRDGNSIEACKSGINGNCDTASDATARIIIALFTASDNALLTDAQKKAQYKSLAVELSEDMLEYEILNQCKQSDLGYGDICYWLAAGSDAKRGGLASTDFGYTGYYGDAIIAMLQACSQTGDMKYCAVASNITLNYLQAADWDGNGFSVPPGRSFKWTNLDGVPRAECTNTCQPVMWDHADAPRAIGMCQANYYAKNMGYKLPGLQKYCDNWGKAYFNIPYGAPLQYYPDGSIAIWYETGYYAQGLQALFQAGGPNPQLFQPTIDSALRHYDPAKGSWDYESCFGVYTHAFPVRALGFGIGRDENSWSRLGESVLASLPEPTPVPLEQPIVEPEPEVETEPEATLVEETPTTPPPTQQTTGPQGTTGAPEPTIPPQTAAVESSSLHIWIKPWYPKEKDYVFVCDARGMEPTSYDWFFGDGDKQLDSNNQDVYHIFPDSGLYRVRCVAKNATTSWATTAEIKVDCQSSAC